MIKKFLYFRDYNNFLRGIYKIHIMDLTFRELQRRLKNLEIGPIAGKGINRDVLLDRYLKQVEEKEDWEDMVHTMDADFYSLISSHISSVPDIRSLTIIERSGPQDIWWYLHNELNNLLSMEGEEEDEERLLYENLKKGSSLFEYVDEKREVTDLFIGKYPYIFLLFLRSRFEAIPLLSSCRDDLLYLNTYLNDEMNLYEHDSLFMRNKRLTDQVEFIFEYEYAMEKNIPHELVSSIHNHAVLYHAYKYDFIRILSLRFGRVLTIATVDARIAIIEHFNEDLTIAERALCLLGIGMDLNPYHGVVSHYLLFHPLFQNTLMDSEAISSEEIPRFHIPGHWKYYSVQDIDDLYSLLGINIIESLDTHAMKLYWPIWNYNNRITASVNMLRQTIMKFFDFPKKEMHHISEVIAFMIYELPSTGFIMDLIEDIVGYRENRTPHMIEIHFMREMVPKLSDEDLLRLIQGIENTHEGKNKLQREIRSLVLKEGKRRELIE